MTDMLETPRLTLHRPEARDWPAWEAFLATDRARFVGGPADVGRAWRAFGHVIGHWTLRGYGSFILREKGSDTPIGLAGPWYPADWPEREIGWSIFTVHAEGRGIAAEAARATIAHAYGTLGWDTAVSYIDPANARSIALAERLGAVRDSSAPRPHSEDLVYRHKRPAGMP